MTYSRAVRVLHSTKAAPAETTRYATHMAAIAGDDVDVSFFSWPRALFGRYDLFHLHWPEAFAADGWGPKQLAGTLLTRLLLLRLRLTRTPVVYTLHNHAPHDGPVSRRLRAVYRGFARLTRTEIHLVPEPDRLTSAETVRIPHGSYVEPFAAHPRSESVPGRALFFGLIRPYKGIETLLAAFAETDTDDAALRVVGQPLDTALAGTIERAAAADARISHRFGFVPDRDLVAEVTAAQLVVLPYRELHSSGAALVALSLERPVLVPDTPTTRALRDEVGDGWVHIFTGTLTADALAAAIRATRERPAAPPDLSARTWDRVRRAHVDAYRRALAGPAADRETVFAWLWGQDDNLGDSALRRGYADALRRRGPIAAYVEDASSDYISGLGLQPGDRVFTDLGAWLAAANAAARRSPATLAINAGEFSLSGGYTLRLLRILPALRRFRRRGGAVVWLGAAVPARRRGRTWLFLRLYRAADLVRWRDQTTSEVFAPAPAMPDWALGLEPQGAAHDAPRRTLGVSLRFDRPYPSAEWIRAVRETAERLGLEIVTVAQVRRDSAYAHRLARDLGGRAVAFGGVSHATHERVLRGEYAGMRAILSDRLHALLIAQTEGAVPLAWTEAAADKLRRHFDALGLPWVTASPDQRIACLRAVDDAALTAHAADSAARLAAARAALDEVRDVLAGDQWRPAPRRAAPRSTTPRSTTPRSNTARSNTSA
ncbi:glycosyltransferase [Microbacterium paludicola]|nr:glycosyltransferase [Microbacterium paludicola]MBF0817524.1 glycosyltransferase [Microbacterium paludicola]